MSDLLLKDVVAALCQDGSDQAREEARARIVANVACGAHPMLDLVTSLQSWLVSENDDRREIGNGLLVEVLQAARQCLLPSEAYTLAGFLTSRLADWPCIEAAARGCLALLQAPSLLQEQHALDMMQTYSGNVLQVQALSQAARNACLQLWLTLLQNHGPAAAASGINIADATVTAIDGEKDPRCLMLSFQCVQAIAHVYHGPNVNPACLREHAAELVELLSAYFPVTFTPPKNDVHRITREGLALELQSSLAVSPFFAPYAVPLLLEKLSSTHRPAKLDALAALEACCKGFGREAMQPHFTAVWESLRAEALAPASAGLSGSDLDQAVSLANEALACLTACIAALGPGSLDLKALTDMTCQDLVSAAAAGAGVEPLQGTCGDGADLLPSDARVLCTGAIVAAVCRSGPEACATAVQHVVARLVELLPHDESSAWQPVLHPGTAEQVQQPAHQHQGGCCVGTQGAAGSSTSPLGRMLLLLWVLHPVLHDTAATPWAAAGCALVPLLPALTASLRWVYQQWLKTPPVQGADVQSVREVDMVDAASAVESASVGHAAGSASREQMPADALVELQVAVAYAWDDLTTLACAAGDPAAKQPVFTAAVEQLCTFAMSPVGTGPPQSGNVSATSSAATAQLLWTSRQDWNAKVDFATATTAILARTLQAETASATDEAVATGAGSAVLTPLQAQVLAAVQSHVFPPEVTTWQAHRALRVGAQLPGIALRGALVQSLQQAVLQRLREHYTDGLAFHEQAILSSMLGALAGPLQPTPGLPSTAGFVAGLNKLLQSRIIPSRTPGLLIAINKDAAVFMATAVCVQNLQAGLTAEAQAAATGAAMVPAGTVQSLSMLHGAASAPPLYELLSIIPVAAATTIACRPGVIRGQLAQELLKCFATIATHPIVPEEVQHCAAVALASVINKWQDAADLGVVVDGLATAGVFDATTASFAGTLHALGWAARALAMRSHPAFVQLLQLLMRHLDSRNHSAAAIALVSMEMSSASPSTFATADPAAAPAAVPVQACTDAHVSQTSSPLLEQVDATASAFQLLSADSNSITSGGLSLDCTTHVVSKVLWQQRTFTLCLQTLLPGSAGADALASISEQLPQPRLLALAYLTQSTSLNITRHHSQQLAPHLLRAMEHLSDLLSGQTSMLVSTTMAVRQRAMLQDLLLRLSQQLLDDAERKILQPHVEVLLRCLCKLARLPGAPLVRETAVQCLMATMELPYHQLHLHRHTVLQTLSEALDDDKRAVRLLAGRCKRLWQPR